MNTVPTSQELCNAELAALEATRAEDDAERRLTSLRRRAMTARRGDPIIRDARAGLAAARLARREAIAFLELLEGLDCDEEGGA